MCIGSHALYQFSTAEEKGNFKSGLSTLIHIFSSTLVDKVDRFGNVIVLRNEFLVWKTYNNGSFP